MGEEGTDEGEGTGWREGRVQALWRRVQTQEGGYKRGEHVPRIPVPCSCWFTPPSALACVL